MKRKWLKKAGITVAALAAVTVAWLTWSNNTFEETFYTMESSKITEPIRVIAVTDLHQHSFGEGNQTLLRRIQALDPDVILLVGDIVNKDSTDWDYAVNLCSGLAGIASTYYGMGNHENTALYGHDLNKDFLDASAGLLGDPPEDFTPLIQDTKVWDMLEATGVILLQNNSVTVDVCGNTVKIGGLSTNASSFWPYSGKFIYRYTVEDPEAFKILMSHRAEPILTYIPDYEIDLVISGHEHGGLVRIPGRGGLFSDWEGLFPKHDAGRFANGDMSLIISRGMGGHGPIPRVFNKPELIVLDIN